MFVPHNCANCVCRNERASCFLAPRIMFVLVFWARVLHHICLRMHIRTRVYVTTNKLHAHGHARRHMCRSSVAGLQAPVDIRPRPPINAGVSQPNPKPHTGPHGLRPAAWRQAWPYGPVMHMIMRPARLLGRRPRPAGPVSGRGC